MLLALNTSSYNVAVKWLFGFKTVVVLLDFVLCLVCI